MIGVDATGIAFESTRKTRVSQWDQNPMDKDVWLEEGTHYRADSDNTENSPIPKEGSVRGGLNSNAKKRTKVMGQNVKVKIESKIHPETKKRGLLCRFYVVKNDNAANATTQA